MLYDHKIDISEAIDDNKKTSKECNICQYWYFNQMSAINVMIY